MRLTFILIVLSGFSHYSYSQHNNFKIILKVEGLDSGYYNFRLSELQSVTGDSVIYNDSLSKEKNTVVIRGFIPEDRFVYFSIRRVGEFDFGIGPGDSVTIVLKNRKIREDFLVIGSIKVQQSAEFINRTLLKENYELEKQQIKRDSIEINNPSQKNFQNWQNEYDSIFSSIFLFNIQYADTVLSPVAAAMALDNMYMKSVNMIF